MSSVHMESAAGDKSLNLTWAKLTGKIPVWNWPAPCLARPSSSPKVHPGHGMEKSKQVQEPQNHHDDYNRIQNCLNRASHRYEAIDQPQQNSNHGPSQFEVKALPV